MLYNIYVKNGKFGWELAMQTDKFDELDANDQYYFNHILQNPSSDGDNHCKVGNTMYDISNY